MYFLNTTLKRLEHKPNVLSSVYLWAAFNQFFSLWIFLYILPKWTGFTFIEKCLKKDINWIFHLLQEPSFKLNAQEHVVIFQYFQDSCVKPLKQIKLYVIHLYLIFLKIKSTKEFKEHLIQTYVMKTATMMCSKCSHLL